MHYYQHHIGDFIKDTAFLTNEEVGIYLKLLWLYYDTENPLPNDIFTLSMKINARNNEDIVHGILNMFFKLKGEYWYQSRCELEISEYQSLISDKSRAGKASAIKRALNKRSTGVEQALNGCTTDEQLTINHKPITNNHIYSDFEKILKAKRKPLTDTLLDSIQVEADKAKMTLEDALKVCCARGWTSFKADWLLNKADVIHQTVPSTFDRDPILVKLDEDAKTLTSIPDDVKAKFKMLKGGK
jgi:uncharacterized protein YdaU (DUF1376 family)